MSTKIAHQTTPDRLFVWMLNALQNPRLVGEITRQNNGDVGLTYGPTWIATGFALSDDMPLVAQTFTPVHHTGRQPGAPGALDDARPDRWGEKVIRYLYKPGASVYDTLYFAGDERFGAMGVSASHSAYRPFLERPLPRLEDASDLNEAVQIIESGEGELQERQRARMGAAGSLGGAKPKAVISIDGEEWVLKFFNGEPFDLPLVEHATMTLAHKAGIDVAQTRPIRLKGEHAIAIKRFDRHNGMRIHSISACTLLRSEVPEGMEPEFGYPQLARALRRLADPRSLASQLHELFRRMIFNILIANTDDHEKNHALLCRIHGRTMTLALSPGYDIVTTGSGALEHQFMITDHSREPNLADAMSVANDFDLSPLKAANEVASIIAVVNDWQAHFQSAGVTDRDITEIAAFVDAPDLLAQRLSFSTADYPLKSPTQKKPRPGAKVFR